MSADGIVAAVSRHPIHALTKPNHGLRNPCAQLDGIQPGLMAAVLDRDVDGRLVRKAGIMGIVLADGDVRPGDPIHLELPPEPRRPLEPV
jgi:MOSC domain-containing protein YiiM